MDTVAPRIRSRHELPVYTPTASPFGGLDLYPERLLLAGAREAEAPRRHLHRDPHRLDHGDAVAGAALADVGHRPLHGDGSVEAVDGQGRVVELVRRRRGRRAGEGVVELRAAAGAREEEVVLVRRVVDEARVQRVLGPDVARAVVNGPRDRPVRIHHWAALRVAR
ncbi:Os01g0727820 [Oryza sativa Japonica Group]|uniref:Os01g0727820 protein n=1 Tax=Oryza sativa subsp. japonica TaxID=39947 RepID=A0A0P0V7N6_ORYSJ|nr:hypothetical protein EE612_005473 [Oryza sativa]BAS74140.1 Os01g0727820 [Oryza sativa Japonica Group]